MLCDLHRIERGPLAEIIGYNPEIQTVRDRFIFPDTTDVHFILAGRIQRLRAADICPVDPELHRPLRRPAARRDR